jgi:cytochrome P450
MVRYCLVDTSIGDLVVVADTKVFIDIIGSHYSRKIWGENAEVFNISRWITEDDGGALESSRSAPGMDDGRVRAMEPLWIPFGSGPKSCIGQSLALHIVDAVIAIVAGKFIISRAPEREPLRFAQTPSMRLQELFLSIQIRGNTADELEMYPV